MTFVSASQFPNYSYRGLMLCVLNVNALVGAFNQEKTLVGALSVIVKSLRTFVPSSSWHADTGHTALTVILLSLHSRRFRHNICFQQGEGATVYSSEYRCQTPWQAACEIPQVAASQLSRYDLSSWEEVPISVLRKILYSVHNSDLYRISFHSSTAFKQFIIDQWRSFSRNQYVSHHVDLFVC